MVPHRKWNVARVYIGIPESGKTVAACAYLVELSRTPAYVIAHDAGGNLPTNFPNGTPTNLKRYRNAEECARGLAASPSGIHAINCPDAASVLALANRIGAASLRAGGGSQGVPVVVYLDEIVNVEDADPMRAGANIKQAITQRRHNHVGIVAGTQMPQLCHYSMLTLANELVVFRCTGERAIKNLEMAGVPRDVARNTIPNLPQYQSVTIKLGF